MLDFKPHKANPFLIQVAQQLLPLMMRFSFKGQKLDIDAESLARLKATEGYPTVLVPNHADYADASIMFALSKRIRQSFYFMTAREIFEERNVMGIKSFFMQRLGAYSVIRGTVDRESFRTTRTLLKTKTNPLVIFAEGGVSRQNDTVMPFESGVVQLCFWALDDMRKAGEVKPLYAIPIAIKYTYDQQMWGEIDKALTRLEQKLDIESASLTPAGSAAPTKISQKDGGQALPNEIATLYKRLRNVGDGMVSMVEREYKRTVDESSSLNDRIQRLREHMLSQMEAFMEITPPAESTPRKRVRILKNLIDTEVYTEAGEMTPDEREAHEQRLERFQQFYRDINRLFNFIAIYDGYVGEKPSQERFLEVITRLEIEVFGTSKPKGRRTAFMRVGTPKNLLDVYETYKKEKRETTQRITVELENEVQSLISNLNIDNPSSGS